MSRYADNQASGGAGTRLARFRTDAGEREVVLLEAGGALTLVDRRVVGPGQDADEREVESSLSCELEARAVAADYARLSEELGRSAMPEPWW